jgi:hypothetical protein
MCGHVDRSAASAYVHTSGHSNTIKGLLTIIICFFSLSVNPVLSMIGFSPLEIPQYIIVEKLKIIV